MKNRIYMMTILVAGLFVLAACSDDSMISAPLQADQPVVATYQVNDVTGPNRGIDLSLDLISKNQSEMGSMLVSNDALNIYVSYYMNASWRILDSFLHFGRSMNDIPLDEGNRPITDRFQYRFSLERGMAVHNMVIPLSEIGMRPGDTVFIASYASVYQEGQDPDNPTKIGMGTNWWNTLRYQIRRGINTGDINSETAILSKRIESNP
jgi:hypothetical protein